MSHPDIKKRISEAQRQRFSNPAEIEKLSAAHKGQKQSAATRAKIAKTMSGRKQSAEHIANRVAAQAKASRGRNQSETLAKAAEKAGGK